MNAKLPGSSSLKDDNSKNNIRVVMKRNALPSEKFVEDKTGSALTTFLSCVT